TVAATALLPPIALLSAIALAVPAPTAALVTAALASGKTSTSARLTSGLLGARGGDLVVESQCQTDAPARDVDLEDLHLDDLAGPDDVVGILHEAARHGGDVHEAVLVHAHVDECTERRDVGDHSLEDHAGLQVGDLLDTGGEGRGPELGTRVAAGLLE